MNHGFSSMSTPPPGYGAPPPGYGAPPPGYGYPPPKKNNTATIVLIVLAAVFGGGIFIVAILAAILFPVFAKVRGNARLAVSESNVKQIDLGLMQYVQDHNMKYPTGNYKQAVMPYIKTESLFHDPADTSGSDSYSFNKKLQGVSLDKISDPQGTVALYEGQNQTLAFRHDGRAVVGFADGSVRAVRAEQAKFLRWRP